MFKTLHITILSFFLLVSSNAFAVQGKKESRFLTKMEKQLNETQADVQAEIAESTDAELMEKYGDVILEMIFADAAIVQELGISQDLDIRSNVELLYSDDAKAFLLGNAEAALEEAGSLKAFKKQVKSAEKALKSTNKGFFRAVGRFITNVVSILVLPFFIIFGPWGWIYWAVLFGHWS